MPHKTAQLDDVGTVVRFTITTETGGSLDLSGATTKQIIFLKPDDETTVTKTAIFTNDGTDGKIQYTTVANDWDTVGKWKVQARVVTPSGDWRTTKVVFWVLDNL